MNVILLSHTATSSAFVVGSHHYLREINSLDKYQALHFSSPDYPLSFLKRKKFKSRKENDFGLFAFFPLGRIKLIDFFSNILLLAKINFEFRKHFKHIDFIIVDQPSFADVAVKLAQKHGAVLIYRPTDVYPEMMGEWIIPHERHILANASGVVSTSRKVFNYLEEKYLKKLNGIFIENGYDDRHFRNLGVTRKFPPKRAVYVGSLDARFDFEALKQLSDEGAEEITIDIYGPLTKEVKGLIGISNVNFKGVVNYDSLPLLLSKYDVGLLPMRNTPSNHGRSPMKLYEYLSCGLPVVARATDGLVSQKLANVYLYDDVLSMWSCMQKVEDFTLMDRFLEEQTWRFKTKRLLDFAEQIKTSK